MSRKKVYISICILGIFVYPLLFQPWHITHHHHAFSIEHSCESDQHEHQSNSNTHGLSINQTSDHCYICDFKFAVKDFPHDLEQGSIVHAYHELRSIVICSYDSNNSFLRINPRAPPALS